MRSRNFYEPRDQGNITRGARVEFSARVEFRATVQRIAWPGRWIILADVTHADGRPARTTGFRHSLPLIIRATGRECRVVGAGGYGGEQGVEVDEWDH